MDSKVKILIGILVVGILLIAGWWVWKSQQEITQSPVAPTITEISREEALELANQVIQPKCEATFTEIKKIVWNMEGPGFENLKNICPVINEYKENKIWRAEKPLNENISVIGLVGVYGRFVCAYALDKKAAPGIITLDKICIQKKGVTIITDKTEYEQGEKIKVIIENNLNQSIWYKEQLSKIFDHCFLILPSKVQKLENGRWKNIELPHKCCNKNIMCKIAPPAKLKLEAKNKRELELKILSSGTYRLKFGYYLSNDIAQLNYIYSNEFTIKSTLSEETYEKGKPVIF